AHQVSTGAGEHGLIGLTAHGLLGGALLGLVAGLDQEERCARAVVLAEGRGHDGVLVGVDVVDAEPGLAGAPELHGGGAALAVIGLGLGVDAADAVGDGLNQGRVGHVVVAALDPQDVVEVLVAV